jgi:predicted 2-oxoglutarate/Fe(II)-dependent dioxygenase YbiX
VDVTPPLAVTGDFLSRELCGRIVEEVERDACWQWGEVSREAGPLVELDFRRSQWCLVPRSCEALIAGRLSAIARGLAPTFGPFRGYEGPNLLRYRPGEFVRAHPDEDPRARLRPRKVTLIGFLNDGGFDGGVLRLHLGGAQPVDITPCAGRFVAFSSPTVHEVTPVAGGNRYGLAAWLH